MTTVEQEVTIRVEVPAGYEVVGFRAPRVGDYYMPDGENSLKLAGAAWHPLHPRIILKKSRWRARRNSGYYYVSVSGDVRHHNEMGLRVDAACFKLGNYFETEQEAEDAAEKIRAAFKSVGVDNG